MQNRLNANVFAELNKIVNYFVILKDIFIRFAKKLYFISIIFILIIFISIA